MVAGWSRGGNLEVDVRPPLADHCYGFQATPFQMTGVRSDRFTTTSVALRSPAAWADVLQVPRKHKMRPPVPPKAQLGVNHDWQGL